MLSTYVLPPPGKRDTDSLVDFWYEVRKECSYNIIIIRCGARRGFLYSLDRALPHSSEGDHGEIEERQSLCSLDTIRPQSACGVHRLQSDRERDCVQRAEKAKAQRERKEEGVAEKEAEETNSN